MEARINARATGIHRKGGGGEETMYHRRNGKRTSEQPGQKPRTMAVEVYTIIVEREVEPARLDSRERSDASGCGWKGFCVGGRGAGRESMGGERPQEREEWPIGSTQVHSLTSIHIFLFPELK